MTTARERRGLTVPQLIVLQEAVDAGERGTDCSDRRDRRVANNLEFLGLGNVRFPGPRFYANEHGRARWERYKADVEAANAAEAAAEDRAS